ncbi:hypothetical protein [endosymbiont GvMRE of Glomus versiforme]|uniref:hypothetical protein n=1 Tax=endosymbiont GvMRE of Glomus versiforme TaxID=2039283 RepID=UPI000EEB7B24|nr:hypothetical protein [endosymbiont GvMRE of Glomus versiforme]RHZ37122.1 hypothetical protein GvMRE_I1g334 [endosymbiont GvMRE of Glomus versiforme]
MNLNKENSEIEKIYNQCSKKEKLAVVAWFDKKYRELQDSNLRGEEWVYYFKIFSSLWEKLPEKEQHTAFKLRVELENHEWPKQPN